MDRKNQRSFFAPTRRFSYKDHWYELGISNRNNITVECFATETGNEVLFGNYARIFEGGFLGRGTRQERAVRHAHRWAVKMIDKRTACWKAIDTVKPEEIV